MAKSLRIRNLDIGQGAPKIVVPLLAQDDEGLLVQFEAALASGADMVEWRADFYEALGSQAALRSCLESLRERCGDVPLLFTLRTQAQGGRCTLTEGQQREILTCALQSGAVDLLDIELALGRAACAELVDLAHSYGVCAVVSNHDFSSTPAYEELYELFSQEHATGADIAKLAVMACEEGDELQLMAATHQFCSDHPDALLVGISMGHLGALTRIAGQFFGSVLTFASAGQASAPGQLEAPLLRTLIRQLAQESQQVQL